MAEQWLVDGPRVIDVGSDRERVEKVVVGIIGGRVNVVTHDDGYGARVEVSNVEGLPLRVSWDAVSKFYTDELTGDGWKSGMGGPGGCWPGSAPAR